MQTHSQEGPARGHCRCLLWGVSSANTELVPPDSHLLLPPCLLLQPQTGLAGQLCLPHRIEVPVGRGLFTWWRGLAGHSLGQQGLAK